MRLQAKIKKNTHLPSGKILDQTNKLSLLPMNQHEAIMHHH